ncbi:DUF305 domain-containing protein [Microbacterium schleiferi]|uniref:DUF305 domain-containing protein n=1 Tax=Microbacterium schleiferi TaxID=69362 RepID=A0A7S8MYZ2_9MICO|nr:DUF305 domain-containing protein [Microbacterium schleiferi]QPE05483.1 DUF305 domain-containing protein [Microbacterium schleiferi]
MRFRTLALTAGALIAALVLAGCASTNNSIPSKYYGPGNRSNAPLAHTGKASVSSADEVFVMTMIRHHKHAIQMADPILANDGIGGQVVTLTEQIEAAQDPEIQTMKGWLEELGIQYDGLLSGHE